MTVFIKNLGNKQIKIYSINLALQAGETRKIVASFENEYKDAKSELDNLVDDGKIEIIDALGKSLSTSEIFTESVQQHIQKISNDLIKSSELNEERFYYVSDIFCISKDESIKKKFKGFTNTLKISVKKKSIKYRIKSQEVVMPWQFIEQDNEKTLQFEYRLKDPEIEFLTGNSDATIKIYIDGYVKNVSPTVMQTFIDTWYEDQPSCTDNDWYNDSGWWE